MATLSAGCVHVHIAASERAGDHLSKSLIKHVERARPNTNAAPAPGIFGIPLHSSIRYANVAISLFNDEGQSYIYGYVPIVVAKCGVFLKEKGKLLSIRWLLVQVLTFRSY